MKELFPDWRAQGVTALPARAPGRLRVQPGLRARARRQMPAEGVEILTGVEVTALELGADDAVTAVETSQGRIEVGEQLVIAPGPWAKQLLAHARPPDGRSTSARRPARSSRDQPMWTYWNLQEGEITVDPLMFATADGSAPPVIHLDTDAPLVRRRRRARHRRALGDLLQARPPRRPGRCLAARRRGRRRARPVSVHDRRRPRLRGHVVRGALALDEPLRGLPPALQAGALRRRRSLHRGQLPGVRLHEAERLHDPRLEPRLQDDRGRARGREGASSASTRACSTRSASSASPRATCTRSRTRRTPGARRPARRAAVRKPRFARRPGRGPTP